MKKILITGANGRVGRTIVNGLRETGDYDVIATDLNADPDSGIQPLDVQDFVALQDAFTGVDTVVHLAWYMQSDQFYEQIVPVNVVGTYNVYETARMNNVRRVIFGSSNHVTGFYKIGETVTPDMPYRPDSLYGLSKCWGELVGQMYADKYGLSSINIRIGNFTAENKPQSLRSLHIWISHEDIVQLTVRCIEADDEIKFLALYGTSANTRQWYEIDYLSDLIGYQPQSNSEDFEADVPTNPDYEFMDFQGGAFIRHEERSQQRGHPSK